jgi:hypothetical protein
MSYDSSARVLAEYSTRWQMSMNPSEFRQSYEVACGEYPNDDPSAEIRFAQSLRKFFETRVQNPENIYFDYKYSMRAENGCPEGSPTSALREQLAERYMNINFVAGMMHLKLNGEISKEDSLLIDAMSDYATAMQHELNAGLLSHDKLVAMDTESRNYWAMKQVVEMTNVELKKLLTSLITWVDVQPSLRQQVQDARQPQFPSRFADVVEAAVHIGEKFSKLRRTASMESETIGERKQREGQINALEIKAIFEFQSLFAVLVTREEGKPKLPPLFADLEAALIDFDQKEWEQHLAQQYSSLDGSFSDFARIAESDDTGAAFAYSLLTLLKYGERGIFDRVINLETSPLKGNKTVEAWVHMVVYLAAHEKLSDQASREIVERTLDLMESSVRSIQDDAKGYGRSQELYKKTAIESMEDNVLYHSAFLLKEQFGNVSSFDDYLYARGGRGGDGESNGSPGAPSSDLPPVAAPVSGVMSGASIVNGAGITIEFEVVGDEASEKSLSSLDRVAAYSKSSAYSVYAAHSNMRLASQVATRVTPLTIASQFNSFSRPVVSTSRSAAAW